MNDMCLSDTSARLKCDFANFLKTHWSIKSTRELWMGVNDILTDTFCSTALFYSLSSPIFERFDSCFIRVFDKNSSLHKVKFEICKNDVDKFIKNIGSDGYIFCDPVKLKVSELLLGLDHQRLKSSLENPGVETFAISHYGQTGFLGFTVFQIRKDANIETKIVSKILANFFSAVHRKNMNLKFEEVRRKVSISPRENDVLQLLATGNSNAEIAENLDISKHTITSYVKVLSLKLNSKNRTVTALRALALGIAAS
jgi:DNA-binding CsgD family transcriptional regulator